MSIWQTKIWWEMLKKSNQVEKIIEYKNIFIEKRKVSLWEYWLFILWFDWILDENLEKELVKICLKEKALFIQIENIDYNWLKAINNKLFKKWYYKKFVTPYTATIDLQKTEEEILNEMKPKWRYNIKLAEKKWVLVKIVNKNDENIRYFHHLMNETTSRDWFNWNTFDYYKTFLNTLDNSKLLLAYFEDNVIAWWIFIFDNDISIYYYWASSSDKNYRNLMSPYLLQREAIKYAKSIWSKIYDFLWITTPWEKNSPLEWVTDFKLKLTKDIVNISESVIYINRKCKYFVIDLLRKCRKNI